MAKPTTAELREHVETDVSDTALQRLIDAEYSALIKTFGAEASQVDDLAGDGERIHLTRQASSIASVVERTASGTETTLEEDDYRIEMGSKALRRLSDGTNPGSCWAAQVRVTYASDDDYFMTVVELVRLRLQYKALQSERSGDHSETAVDFQAERQKLMRGIALTRRLVA